MAAIHLIKNDPGLPQIAPITRGSDFFHDGYWAITEAEAKALIGGNIYFHRHKADPSFFGGVITGTETSDEYPGRIGFIFKPDPNGRGNRTPPTGWRQELKIVQ